eukprot:g3968.t1
MGANGQAEIFELRKQLEEKRKELEEKNTLVRRLRIENATLTKKLKNMTNFRAKFESAAQLMEAEEEAVTLRLMKKLSELKEDRGRLAVQVEQEEEFLTNTLQKRLNQVIAEKNAVEARAAAESAQLAALKLSREKIKRDFQRMKIEKQKLLFDVEREEEYITNKFLGKLETLQKENIRLQLKLEQEAGSGATETRYVRSDANQFRIHSNVLPGSFSPMESIPEVMIAKTLSIAAAMLAFGTMAFQKLEKQNPVNAFYLSGMTLTTVGYGDLHPTNNESKAFMVLYALLGVGIFGSVVSKTAEWRDAAGGNAGNFFGLVVSLAITVGVGVAMVQLVPGFDSVCGRGGKPLSLSDAVYFSLVSATTVGYGDICPESDEAKIAMVFYALFSLGAVATICDEFKDLINERLDALGIKDSFTRLNLAAFVLLILGTLCFEYLEKELSHLDAFYLSGITLTTVGYGDFSPTNEKSKIFMIVLSMFGLGIFGGVIEEIGKWRDNLPFKTGMQGMLLVLATTCGAGVFLFSNLPMNPDGSPLGVSDAVYFSVVTGTSIGYGDISPQTDTAKLATVLYALFSLAAVGFVCDVLKDLVEGVTSGTDKKGKED